MLTKSDLSAIQKMLNVSKTETIDIVQKNTEDLIELIIIGFKSTDKAIERLSEHDEIIDDHEHRLDRIEDKVFV